MEQQQEQPLNLEDQFIYGMHILKQCFAQKGIPEQEELTALKVELEAKDSEIQELKTKLSDTESKLQESLQEVQKMRSIRKLIMASFDQDFASPASPSRLSKIPLQSEHRISKHLHRVALFFAVNEANDGFVIDDINHAVFLRIELTIGRQHTAVTDSNRRVCRDDIAQSVTQPVEPGLLFLLRNRIDVGLINNAGVSSSGGAIEQLDLSVWRTVFEVNVFSMVSMCSTFLPLLRKCGSGGVIINISSIAGIIGRPFAQPYSASKYAVESLSDSLRREVEKFGIKVVVIQPGNIESLIADKSLEQLHSSNLITDNRIYPETRSMRYQSANSAQKHSQSPAVIACIIDRALRSRRPKTRYRAGGQASMGYLISLLPTSMQDMVSRRLSPKSTVAMTRAPNALPIWMAAIPTPPAPACTSNVSPGFKWPRNFNPTYDVGYTMPYAAACSKVIPSSICRSCICSTATIDEKAPIIKLPNTRSPTLNDVTLGPIAATTPENSDPGMKGRFGFVWYLPCIINPSKKFSPTE